LGNIGLGGGGAAPTRSVKHGRRNALEFARGDRQLPRFVAGCGSVERRRNRAGVK
jgi:hypothetical protein